MAELWLLRHAKSDWGDPGLADIDRPLNARGRGATAAMGREMARLGLVPDRILASPAQRVAQTLAGLRLANPDWPEAVVEPAIYAASVSALQRLLAHHASGARNVLLIGHYPGIAQLALAQSRDDGSADRTALADHYPTGALSIIVDWGMDRPGRLARFVRPRDLA